MVLLLIASLTMQVLATGLALRVIRVSGRHPGWTCLLLAACVMAARRLETLIGVVAGSRRSEWTTEIVALVVSVCLAVGLFHLERLFRELTDARRAAAERESRLIRFLRHTPLAMALFDRQLRCVAHSLRWTRDLRLPSADCTGADWTACLPDAPPVWRAALAAALHGERSSGSAEEYRRGDGRLDIVRWEINPKYNAEHEVGGVIVYLELLTEQKQLETTLLRSHRDLELRRIITEIANVADDVARALQLALREIARHLDWPLAHAFVLSAEPSAAPVLVSSGQWHQADAAANYVAFRQLTELSRIPAGADLPGLALAAGRAVCRQGTELTGDPALPRWTARVPLHAGLAIPILLHGRVTAVLEFFTAGLARLDPADLALYEQLGGQLGRCFERAQAAEQVSRLLSILDAAPDHISIVNPDGTLQYLNRAGREIAGLAPDADLHELSLRDFHPPWAWEKIAQFGLPTAVRVGSWTSESALRAAAGRDVPVSQTLVAHRSPQGVAYYSTIQRDISQLKQVERALRRSEELFQAFMDHCPALAFLADGAGRYVYGNRRLLRLFPRLEGLPAPVAYHEVHPPEIERQLLGHSQRVLDSGEALEVVEIVPAADGTPHDWLVVKFPVPERDGSCLVGGVAVDITERRRLEAQLDRFFQLSTDVLAILDSQGRLQQVGPALARLLECDPPFRLPCLLRDLVHPDDAAAVDAVFARLQAGAELDAFDCRFRTARGAVRAFSWRLSPVTREGLVFAVGRDVTAERHSERERDALFEQLAQKNVELEQFSRSVSHDLKSPLLTIQGFLGFIDEALQAGDLNQARTDLQRISHAAARMRQLIDEFFQLVRMGTLLARPVDVPLSELAREAAGHVAGRAIPRGVEIEVDPALPIVCGDRNRLLDLLQNLLDNAVKFLGDQPAPRVAVGCRRDGPEVVCYVRDNGIGIEPRHHEQVFHLFEKLSPQSEGTGVGLATARRVVELHGGRIWIESPGPNQGTTVCFVLPLAAEQRPLPGGPSIPSVTRRPDR